MTDNYNNLSENSAVFNQQQNSTILIGNNCYYNSYGIDINTGNNSIIRGNSSMWNSIHGIRLEQSDTNILTGSRALNNGAYGIYITNSACDNNIATGNQLPGNSTGTGFDISGGDTTKANNFPSL